MGPGSGKRATERGSPGSASNRSGSHGAAAVHSAAEAGIGFGRSVDRDQAAIHRGEQEERGIRVAIDKGVVGMTGGYSLEMFGRMFVDRARHDAYVEGMRRSIAPGDVVLDLGTGIGIYALVAARLGARKVYAVEPNPLVRLGPDLARRNGLDDRIEFIEAMSTGIDLPEPANVVVADLRGVLPFHGLALPSLLDARRRHLAPGGVLLPSFDRIYAAPATNARAAAVFRDRWIHNELGLDLAAVADAEANALRRDPVSPSDLMTDPVEVATIDYGDLGQTGFRHASTTTTIRPGTADGIAMWFEGSVLDGLAYSTGPHHPATVYGMAFLPFRRPVDLDRGSELSIGLSADLVGDDYIWSWTAAAVDTGGERWSAEQSTFKAAPIDPSRLARRKASHRPVLSPLAEVDATILTRLGHGLSLGEVAAEVVRTGSVRLSEQDALTRVADLAERYGA